MAEQLAPNPVFRAWSNIGLPLVGGKLFTYIAGTTTKQASYTDSTGGTPNTNPVILNFRGEANVWLDPTKIYKFVLAPATDTDPPSNPFWTVDNISGGAASPSFSIIPTVDNLFTLGNTSFSWANVYVGPNHAPVLGASGNIGYYKRIAAEVSLGVIPADFSYPADPYIDPRRYGADPTGGVDSSLAMQTALNVAVGCNGVIWIGENCNFKCGNLSLTLTSILGNGSMRIIGASNANSLLTLTGTPSALITFNGSTPTGAPQQISLVIENLSLQGPAHAATTDGIALNGVANIVLRNITILGFSACVNCRSALDVYFDNVEFALGRYGAYCRTNGTGSPDNRLIFNNCTFVSNNLYGLDFDGGSHLHVLDCDLEGNGTLANFSTGAIHIGANINNTLGFSIIAIDGCWFESNNGWGITVDTPASGQSKISISNGFTIADDTSGGFGHAILVSNAWTLAIKNFVSGPNSKWDLTCNQGLLENTGCQTLADANIVWPTYINVDGNGTHSYSGRIDSFTATLTGCTTSPTGTVTVVQQGSDITLEIPSISATSNTTACTLTGLPAKYQPAFTQNFITLALNNSAGTVVPFQVTTGSGTLTYNFTFTNSGTKGSTATRIDYKLVA